jgi:hypothetical protein
MSRPPPEIAAVAIRSLARVQNRWEAVVLLMSVE